MACESDHEYLQPLLALRPLLPGGRLALGPGNAKYFGSLGELLTCTAIRPAAVLGYTYPALCEVVLTIPLIHGYARASKLDREEKNLETQPRELAQYRPHWGLISGDYETGTALK